MASRAHPSGQTRRNSSSQPRFVPITQTPSVAPAATSGDAQVEKKIAAATSTASWAAMPSTAAANAGPIVPPISQSQAAASTAARPRLAPSAPQTPTYLPNSTAPRETSLLQIV